jgi:hypothetical protein
MAEIRRGTAMLLLTAGDKEISTALADGILAVRLPMANSLSHAARASSLGEGALTKEQREMVSGEINKQRIADELREKLHPVPVDYAGLAYGAEVKYGESLYEPGVLGRIGEALMVGYAMIVMGFHELFESLGLE